MLFVTLDNPSQQPVFTAALPLVHMHALNARFTTMIYLNKHIIVMIVEFAESVVEKITFIAQPADLATLQICGIITCA